MNVSAYLKASIAVALAATALKTGAWWVSGSVSRLSDALESLVNLAGAMVALAIIAAVVHRRCHPQRLEAVGPGLELSVVSSAMNGAPGWSMLRKAREARSVALEADARHLFTDVWTSAGVVLGLLAVMAPAGCGRIPCWPSRWR